ncbi:Patatin [Xaviernesmea oryzae]|uniref:Patatin n=1 Tax=Xaviernesmea oryzae TaxID=464029 RepID=A0A1Q9ATI8_9HYPH|nr:patatin-like phospholipase family protein [Xaviernesmea oryzae]OLP58747.1 Patatin [Xaviernesmea oryzae]SEK71542.1 NTE family protein [Xaviernesmea oryzae]
MHDAAHLQPRPAEGVNSPAPRIGLAFGGGGARGLAHIHVIEALDEMGIKPFIIAGSSIGAIMGAAMAAGMRGAEIREVALATVGRRADVIARLWRLRPTSFAEMMSGTFGLGPYSLERVLEGFLPETIPRRFEDLAIPLIVVATDYYAQTEIGLTKGDLRQAIAASAAIPGVFQPVRVEGRVMIDGGIVNPVPFDQLTDKAEIVIGVDVVGGPEGDGTTVPGRMDVMFGATQLMMQAIIGMKSRAAPPTFMVRPDVGRFRVLDFLKAQEILTRTAPAKDSVKRALEEALRARGGSA